MHTGGILLCGGKNRRMGRAKPTLPFGPESMLARVVRLLSEAVDPIVIVAAVDQELPKLPDAIAIVRDEQPERGPLEGLAAGFRWLANRSVESAFVTACDVPLLVPAFVRCVVDRLEDFDIAVPHVDGFDEPLAAVYRTSVLSHIEALLATDRLRPVFLFDRVPTRRISREELLEVDLELQSLKNVNTPDDYRSALHRAGFD